MYVSSVKENMLENLKGVKIQDVEHCIRFGMLKMYIDLDAINKKKPFKKRS